MNKDRARVALVKVAPWWIIINFNITKYRQIYRITRETLSKVGRLRLDDTLFINRDYYHGSSRSWWDGVTLVTKVRGGWTFGCSFVSTADVNKVKAALARYNKRRKHTE